MEQITVTHVNGTTLKLQSKENASTITRAEQTVEKLGQDVVDITVVSGKKLVFEIGDKITVIGRDYTLNQAATETKTAENEFTYELHFEGAQYDMIRAGYSVNVNTTDGKILDIAGSSLTGTIKIFLDVLIANMNRVFPGKWSLGTYPSTDTTVKTLTFSDSDNCLSVLQMLCGEENFKTEFSIDIAGSGNRTLNVGSFGNVFGHTFEFGRGKGLYNLTREKQSTSNIVTRLFVYGSTRNINTTKYRADRLCLPSKSKAESYVEDAAAIAKYGVWEGTKVFEDVYPKMPGKPNGPGFVTSLGENVFELIDTNIDFDLNAKDENGKDLYLFPGTTAKLHFNSGNLAGYEFEIEKYDHPTTKFTLIQQTDANGMKFPSETSAAFQFAENDEYVLLDINMPKTYTTAAETLLATKADEYLATYKQPLVQYGLSVDKFFLKRLLVGEEPYIDTNAIWVGDYMPIKDTDIEVDKTIRVKSFRRNLLDDCPDYSSIEISDLPANVTVTTRVLAELKQIEKVIRMNTLDDPARARRNWKVVSEIITMIETLQAEAALIGNDPAAQYLLSEVLFSANYQGNPNNMHITACVLAHSYYPEGNPGTWNVSAADFASLESGTPYYLYIKASKSDNTAVFFLSSTKIAVESVAGYYHFPVGILSSVISGRRVFQTTKGYTLISGDDIKTGRISSPDGTTFIDLNTGEIRGSFSFQSGEDVEDVIEGVQSSLASTQNYIDSTIGPNIGSLQDQIDGQIESHFKEYDPTTANLPASSWDTAELKQQHANDTFTNTLTGGCWRWQQVEGVWGWGVISDTATQQALTAAARAQNTANGKRRVFVVQPTTPYEVGDLWTQGTTGDLMKCKTERLTGSYVAGDWEKASKYTDDTTANNIQVGGRNYVLGSDVYITAANMEFNFVDFNAWRGQTITLSVEVELVNATSGRIGFEPALIFADTTTMFLGCWLSVNSTTSTKKRISATFSIPDKEITGFEQSGMYVQTVATTSRVGRPKIEIGNKATDWTPSPEDVEAYTQTKIDGGLVTTGRVEVGSGTLGNVNAGMSGAGTSADSIRFWAGNTYANRGAAPFRVQQDGKAFASAMEILSGCKIGSFNILNGNIIGYDTNRIETIRVAIEDMPTITQLSSNWVSSGYNNFSVRGDGNASNVAGTGTIIFPTKEEAYGEVIIPYATKIKLDLGTYGFNFQNQSVVISSSILYYLKVYDTNHNTVYSGYYTDNQEIALTVGGHYNLILECRYQINVQSGQETDFHFAYMGGNEITYLEAVQKTAVGKNGFYSYFSYLEYLHFKAGEGFMAKVPTSDKWDTPGVLASGSVASGGGLSRQFGALLVSSSKTATGTYRVYHNIKHTNFSVSVTPLTAARLSYISTKTAYNGTANSGYVIIVMTNTSGTETDTAFDFMITGLN